MRFVPDSAEAVRAYVEAEDLATQAGQPLSSIHLLLALFESPNRAQILLKERSVDAKRVRQHTLSSDAEPRRSLQRLKDRAREIARTTEANEVDCLHVLVAMSRLRESAAYRTLTRTGISLTALRNVAVSYITGSLPRRYRALPAEAEDPAQSVAPMGTSPRKTSAEDAPTKPRPREIGAQRARRAEERPAPQQHRPASEEASCPPPARPEPRPESSGAGHLARRGAENDLPPPRPQSVAAQQGTALRVAPRPRDVPAALRLEDVAPTLATVGIDLTEQARLGSLDAAIGRQRELEALIDVLGKRRANNPVLVGPPGVGKTAIVEGLAVKIARQDQDVALFRDHMVVSLDTGALVAGTSLRGAFSERLGAIKSEVAAANRQIIVFIDELHTLIGAGTSGEGPQDAANELKSALARGEFPCIGATTVDEFKRYVERDAALERRFTPVYVEEPSPEDALLIVAGGIRPYAEHHGAHFSLEALHAAVNLSHRFVNERKLPDKAFAVLDLAGSRARRAGAHKVERADVARVVHEWSAVPLERLLEADAERFARTESILSTKLVGHPRVLATVAQAIRRGFAGFSNRRPMGSFLFLGPSGVGKTELVKILAEFIFGRRDAMVRFDMSELAEKHAVARLIGAQPGYIGYEEGGQLTEALRKRPFQIVLFDEVEKAHPDVLNLLLQILDEGQLTDSRGRRVSFSNTLVILTSNLGTQGSNGPRGAIGFGGDDLSADPREQSILTAARAEMRPELWSRLDERLVFLPLTRDEVREVAKLQLEESSRNLWLEREVRLEWTAAVPDFLLEHGGFNPQSGARGMRQAIARHVEGPVAELLLAGKLRGPAVAHLAVKDAKVMVSGVLPRRLY